MKKFLFLALALAACSAPQRQPSSKIDNPYPWPLKKELFEKSAELMGDLKNPYVKNPITGSLDNPRNWEALYRSRIAAAYCGLAAGEIPHIQGENRVVGPSGLSFLDKYSGFEEFNGGRKEAVSAWVGEQNIRTFARIGCTPLHHRLWRDSLATMKRPVTYSIAFDDLAVSNLLSLSRRTFLEADGLEGSKSFTGLRATKPENKEKPKVKVPVWMEKLLGEFKDSVIEIVPLGVGQSLVKIEKPGTRPGGILVRASDQSPPNDSYLYCSQDGCGWQITNDALYFQGVALAGDEFRSGIVSVSLSSRKQRLVYEIDPDEVQDVPPALFLGDKKPLVYRLALHDRIIDFSLVKSELEITAKRRLLSPDATVQALLWTGADELTGISIRGTKPFLWRRRDILGEEKYREWNPPEHTAFYYVDQDKKGRAYAVGAGEGSALVAYSPDAHDKLEKIFDESHGEYRTELRYATSPDGHRVPLLVRYRAGMDPASGRHPVVLEGYGGSG